MQLSKKKYIKKKANKKEASHWEGKVFCNCKTRNIRKYLGYKLHGQPERSKREDAIGIITHDDWVNNLLRCGALNSMET
jgi:hypothetical protein